MLLQLFFYLINGNRRQFYAELLIENCFARKDNNDSDIIILIDDL